MAANKVLLVDDDPSIIEVLKLYFEKEGYQVVTCMQGDKAFAVFNTSKPDIIILDLMLPGKDRLYQTDKAGRIRDNIKFRH